MNEWQTLIGKVEKIETNQTKQIEQTAVLTHIIHEHERRSTQLETRVLPLEDDLKFRQKLYVLVMGSSGLIAIVSLTIAVLSYFHSKG